MRIERLELSRHGVENLLDQRPSLPLFRAICPGDIADAVCPQATRPLWTQAG
jgi:hypothetical protein